MQRLILCLFLMALPSTAADWTRFRGSDGGGIAEGNTLPSMFDPDINLNWSIDLPMGKSSPTLSRDRICITATKAVSTFSRTAESSLPSAPKMAPCKREPGSGRRSTTTTPRR